MCNYWQYNEKVCRAYDVEDACKMWIDIAKVDWKIVWETRIFHSKRGGNRYQ